MKRVGSLSIIASILMLIILVHACRSDDDAGANNPLYDETPYAFQGAFPPFRFPAMDIPADNPITAKSVELGRMLFYDPIISIDSSLSCAGCHNPQFNFTDNGLAFSTNALGQSTARISMPLINSGWITKGFFWDGRAATLEDAVLDAIINEHHPDWTASINAMMDSEEYKRLYAQAFKNAKVNELNTVKAIASFIRIMISQDAKIDKFFRGQYQFTELEAFGFDSLFNSEKGDCFHCHGFYPFLTDNDFHNNGVQAGVTNIQQFPEKGLGLTTGKPEDYGKVKTPTLRNLIFSAPYMHDGRFETLDDVIEFYSSGLHASPTIDPLMKNVDQGGVQLNAYQKEALKAFLLTFTDSVFINNPEYANPF
jgi:cytochrome c peroxidase